MYFHIQIGFNHGILGKLLILFIQMAIKIIKKIGCNGSLILYFLRK